MSTISTALRRPDVAVGRRIARAKAVAAAVAGTLAVWVIATAALGVDLHAPAFEEGAANPAVGAGTVALTTLAAGLGAWALLALAERVLGARARTVWTVLAVVALAASFGGPLSGTGADAESRAVLASMHVVAAAILVPLLRRTSAATRREA